MRAQAAKLFANVDTVSFQTKSKTYVINARELEIVSLCIDPYECEIRNYDRRESKTGEKIVATELNSIPVGLPLSLEGIWPAPTTDEEDALCRSRIDCMQLQPRPAQFALRTYNTGTSPPSGPASSGQPS